MYERDKKKHVILRFIYGILDVFPNSLSLRVIKRKKKKVKVKVKGKGKRKIDINFEMCKAFYITVSVTSSRSPFEKTLDTRTFQSPS